MMTTQQRIEGRMRTISRYHKMLEEIKIANGKNIVIDVHVFNNKGVEVSEVSNGANKTVFIDFIYAQIEWLEMDIECLREYNTEEGIMKDDDPAERERIRRKLIKDAIIQDMQIDE